MQNKANVKIGKMNLRLVDKKDYENMSDWTLGENKPNQSQFSKATTVFLLITQEIATRFRYR